MSFCTVLSAAVQGLSVEMIRVFEAVGQHPPIGHAAALVMEVLEELELRAALADILEVADIVVAHGSLVELGEGDLAVVVKHHVH